MNMIISPISYWREKKKEYQCLNKAGRVISFTKINNPPLGFGKIPYYSVLVKLNNGQKKTSQLVLNGKKPRIGAKVKAIIRISGTPGKKDIINYGIKFKLI